MLVCDRVKALRFIGGLLCCKPDRSLWPVLIRIVVPKLLNLINHGCKIIKNFE
jgi:hypothetical protein